MKNSIKYFATILATLAIATGCNVADTNEDETTEVISKIVYLSDMDGPTDIYTSNADGSDQKRLTSNDFMESNPAISPAGTMIAYSQQGVILTMNIDGSGSKIITSDDCNDEDECIEPNWSPDGNKITYSSAGDIFVMNADGSGSTNITDNRNAIEYAPKWSPDGSEIAFTQKVQSAAGTLDAEIVIINVETKEQIQVTNNEVDDEYADWSPDGTELIHIRKDDSGDVRLYISRVSAPNSTELPGLPAGKIDLEARPCWGGDDYIYFTSIESPRDGAKGKAKATSHNASRSNRSSGIISDIVTDGDTKGLTCIKELDKSSTK